MPSSVSYTLTQSYHRLKRERERNSSSEIWSLEIDLLPLQAFAVIEKGSNKTEQRAPYVKELNQSVAFLSKKAVEFSRPPPSVFPSRSD